MLFIFHPQKGIPEVAASRPKRWAITLAAYDYEVHYKPSTQHGNADALSRLPLDVDDDMDREQEEMACAVEEPQLEKLPLNGKDIRTATEQGSILSQVFNYTLHSWPKNPGAVPKEVQQYFSKRTQFTLRNGWLARKDYI